MKLCALRSKNLPTATAYLYAADVVRVAISPQARIWKLYRCMRVCYCCAAAGQHLNGRFHTSQVAPFGRRHHLQSTTATDFTGNRRVLEGLRLPG
jgi:hypothetical protein